MGNFTLHTEGKKYWIVVGPHSEGGKSGKVLALIEESEARIKAGKNKQTKTAKVSSSEMLSSANLECNNMFFP